MNGIQRPVRGPLLALGLAGALLLAPLQALPQVLSHAQTDGSANHAAGDEGTNGLLRVCADGNNLPYSNKAGEGFENALALLLAEELQRRVEYTWWPQRRGFVRNTLGAGRCDVIMGVPADYELTATTDAYYRSGYVAVTRAADQLDITRLEDERLRDLRIGVHIIGDDYSNPPPVQVLGRQGIRDNVTGYSIYGDYSKADPTRGLIDAVAFGEIDVALAWGPIAGFFARQQADALRITPVSTSISPLPMAFDIAIGVREEDEALRRQLNDALRRRSEDVQALLARYGIPLISQQRGPVIQHMAEYRGEEGK